VSVLRRRLARATATVATLGIVGRIVTTVVSIAIARALDPEEVGLLGLAVIVVGLLSVIASCAETACVLNRAGNSDSRYGWAAFVIRGGMTAVLVGALGVCVPEVAPLLAGDAAAAAQLIALVHILQWQLILELGGTYPRVILQRRLKLSVPTVATLLQILTHAVLTLVCLQMDYGAAGVAWACVIAPAVGGSLLWVWLLRHEVLRSDGGMESGLWKAVAGSTARVCLGSVMGYLNGRLDNILVAGALGSAAMSFYGLAWSASRLPLWIIDQIAGLVLTPALSHFHADVERIGRIAREALQHSYLVLAPLSALVCVAAPALVSTVFGSVWLPSASCLRVMAITILMGPLIAVCNGVLVATDRAQVTSIATGAHVVALLATVVPLANHWGILGAAWADLMATSVLTIALCVVCWRSVWEEKLEIVSTVWLPIVAAGLAGILAERVVGAVAEEELVRLVLQALVITVAYPVAVVCLGGKRRLLELMVLIRHVMWRDVGSSVTA